MAPFTIRVTKTGATPRILGFRTDYTRSASPVIAYAPWCLWISRCAYTIAYRQNIWGPGRYSTMSESHADNSPPDSVPKPSSVGASDLLPLVYDELRTLARHRMAHENVGHTLQATALVHEAYLRLGGDEAQFANRAHFFHAAAEAMRRILIDHARQRGSAKRGGGARRLPTNVLDLACAPDSGEIVALDDAIGRLEKEAPQAASVVRLRFYAGLSVEETAEALNISPRTVNREWTFARAWLFRVLELDPSP